VKKIFATIFSYKIFYIYATVFSIFLVNPF
jgi:hypothetical protein